MRVLLCLRKFIIRWLFWLAVAGVALSLGRPLAIGAEVTLQRSLVYNGACAPKPTPDDHEFNSGKAN